MTEKDRFEAVSDNGRRYVIVEHQHWVTFTPLNGSVQELPGSTELLTDEGLDVSANSDGSYTVLQDDVIVRRLAE